MSDILERLHNHCLPDPCDEREVMHAPLLREAATCIKELRRERDEARQWAKDCLAATSDSTIRDELIKTAGALNTLRARIEGVLWPNSGFGSGNHE